MTHVSTRAAAKRRSTRPHTRDVAHGVLLVLAAASRGPLTFLSEVCSHLRDGGAAAGEPNPRGAVARSRQQCLQVEG
jgi:hypothetical protein